MSSSKTFSVYLSGGGIKGAYQYGFFKQVYAKCPEFKIDKLCCSSVGSLNALPIMARRMDYLEYFWESKDGKSPIEKILVPWKSGQLGRAMHAKTVYAGMDIRHLERFWDECDASEQARMSDVTVLSYNSRTKGPVSERCVDKATLVGAIEATCCFPGLYPPNPRHPHIIDGYFIEDVVPSLPRSESPWVCLDLTHERAISCGIAEHRHKDCDLRVYSPSSSSNAMMPLPLIPPIFSCIACIDVRSTSIQKLIEQGEEAGEGFLSTI